VFNYLEFGDVDWSYLTKFYEMENWNFQVVKPQNSFYFFFDDFDSDLRIDSFLQDGENYFSSLFSHLFQLYFPFSKYVASFNDHGYRFFFELGHDDKGGFFDALLHFFSFLNFFTCFGWGSIVIEGLLTGFFYSPYWWLIDIFGPTFGGTVFLFLRGFDSFDDLLFDYAFFFFFFFEKFIFSFFF
jgi:hypothetical protein